MIIAVDSKNPFAESAFSPFGTVRVLPTAEMHARSIRDADAIIVRSETRVDRTLLEGSAVRFVGTATIGIDHVDASYLREKRITFAYAPGSNANSVSEYVLSALMVVATSSGSPLHTMSLGIVGLGNVGSRVARMAASFGIRILRNDPPLDREGAPGPFVPLDDILSCDFVSIHVPLTRDGQDPTFHLFDEKRIRGMKKGAVLINTSRGAVVDGEALLKALRTKHLGGAVLDVWEGEPAVNTRLLELVNIGTPHIAGYSFDGKLNAVRMMVQALHDFAGTSTRSADSIGIPASREGVIEAPHTHTPSLEHGVLCVTKQCYDIQKDDERMRELLRIPLSERAGRFRSMRSDYPVRREFTNFTVRISPDEVKMRSILAGIGFGISPT